MTQESLSTIQQRAAEHWRLHDRRKQSGIRRWWQSPPVLRFINELVAGKPSIGLHDGFHELIARQSAGKPIIRAISVACGAGQKEMQLLRIGIVDHFDLYEVTESRIETGRKLAAEAGLSERACFHLADAFHANVRDDYDMVYWNNALHHMLDVEQAIDWSFDRLRDDGLFAMDDFVGPSRFQWLDRNLEIANRFLKCLPDRIFVHPDDSNRELLRQVRRPTIEAMIAADPTEAADSERIIPSLMKKRPEAQIILSGGGVYLLALSDRLANMDPLIDRDLFELAFFFEHQLLKERISHYAIALARKTRQK